MIVLSAFGQPSQDAVVHDMCGKTVAMLGESPVHGFGGTLEFKAGLVRRLIDECHYNAFFIESGTYDFLNIQKRLKSGQEVTEPMVAAAIGGLWATHEVEPLIPFLLAKAKAGSVTLGGLDDQLGRGTYAQRGMPADLVEHLQGEEKAGCLAILQRHMLWQYTNDAPYGPEDKSRILGCLDQVSGSEYDLAMAGNLERLLARDFRPGIEKGANTRVLDGNDRDRSMYQNFQWLWSRLPVHSKVIVWSATTHIAKDLSGVSGEEGVVQFGSYIHKEFKDGAFALGFSALTGSYAMANQPAKQLSAAPGDSLEAMNFADGTGDTVYLSWKDLEKAGPIQARPLGTSLKTAKWNDVLDGLVILREERVPDFIRR